MSDKIPISLHNSDLFLNPEFTDTDKKKSSTDNPEKAVFKKGPTLGENNHLVSLHSSYLLPPLHTSTYLNKAVSSYLLTKQKLGNRHKKESIERSKGYNGVNQSDKQSNDKQNEALLPAIGSSFGPDIVPFRYELRSRLTPSSKLESELKKQDHGDPEPSLPEKTEKLPLNQQKNKVHLFSFVTEINNHTKSYLSGFFLKVLKRTNKGISLSISREFLLITINLILFSVLAIVQRGHSGKSFCLTDGNRSQTRLFASKISNTTPAYFNAAGVRQHLNPMKVGHLNPVREHVVGIFLGKPDTCACTTGAVNRTGQAERVKKKNLSFFLLPAGQALTNSYTRLSLTDTPQKSADFEKHLVKPWYFVRACNTSKNRVIATRSLWSIDTNVSLYDDTQIRGFQYYLPFYKTQERVLTEGDTIPAKRDTVYHKRARSFESSRKLQTSSCTTVSQSVLTRFFYKYGLLLVSSSKKAQAFKEKKGSLHKSDGSDPTKERLTLTKSENNALDEIGSHKHSRGSTTAINKAEFEQSFVLQDDAILQKDLIKMQNGYVVLAKRNRAWFCITLESAGFVNKSNRNPARHKAVELVLGQNLANSMAIKTRSYVCFTTLKTTGSSNPFVSSHERSSQQNSYCGSFILSFGKGLLPIVNEAGFDRYSFALNKINNLGRAHRNQTNALFPFGSVWSQCNLDKLTFAALVPLQDHVPAFGFIPDSFVRDASVSGYQFPDLQDKEISYLFRKIAIFHFYFHKQRTGNKTFFQKLFTQVTTPFRTLEKIDLISQTVSTPFMINENGVLLYKARSKDSPEVATRLGYLSKRAQLAQRANFDDKSWALQESNRKDVRHHKPSFEIDGIQMQYTQMDLDDIKNVSNLFTKLGRNYEDYLHKPKDSLPALIISPSLEDDREIEEEGIRIFHKRDFVKNKKSNPQDRKGIAKTSFLHPEFSEKKSTDGVAASKSEIQNHQLLVKNALRQAQEEIDNIAKKEEKGTDKDKQVIPPLTRLEALYTIRNREKKHEQSKDLVLDKGPISDLRFAKTKLWMQKLRFCKKNLNFCKNSNKTKLSSRVSKTGRKKGLVLYSDRPNDYNLNKSSACKDLSFCTTKLVNGLLAPPWSLQELKQSFSSAQDCGFTPWLFSKFGDETICTDRKHSFFGEMSLASKKVTAQEQKQIFQQKANPLLKIKPKDTGFEKVDHYNLDLDSVSGTVPLSLLSRLSVLGKANDKKNPVDTKTQLIQKQSSCKNARKRFKVGTVKVNRLPASMQVSKLFARAVHSPSSSLYQNEALEKNKALAENTLPSHTALKKVTTGHVQALPDPFRSKNRIYFYENLSQNKPCQGSAPKIKSTPLQSPVSHRVWQAKRAEPSTFRVSERIKSTPVLPNITQKDWKNIVEWQLKKYFVEEDKRLLPLSLNNNKRLKVKRINLYLPWISIKKANDSLIKRIKGAGIVSCQPLSAWPLTRLDLITNPTKSIDSDGLFSEPNNGKDISRLKFGYDLAHQRSATYISSQPTSYWRLPTQQNLYAASCCKGGCKRSAFAPTSFLSALPLKRQTNPFFVSTEQGAKQDINLQTIGSQKPVTSFDNKVVTPKRKIGICEKGFNESILFESVTRYSWLFVYTFFSVIIFKQLFIFVYKLGLKDFFINFLNSDFGRTITSEEFRYSIQNSPLTEFYTPKKRLKELFGLERNKVQLLEIVWFLRNRCQGRHGVRGILLVGPPGVESVSVVQAIAGEANLPIVVQSLEKIAQDNEPQRQLEQLYLRAQKQAPCVLFLDQLDTVGARRDQLFTESRTAHNKNPLIFPTPSQGNQMTASLSSQSSLNSHMSTSVSNVSPEEHLFESNSDTNSTISSNPFQKNQTSFLIDEQNAALNKDLANISSLPTKQSFVSPGNKLNVVLRLLTILDGITQSSGVVTVATARDLTKLDPALLRPKRFDRKIYLSLPNQQDRVHLFKMHTQSIGHIKEIPWNYLSLQTESMSAADIRSAINYSLFRAVLQNSAHTVETLEYGISCVKSLTDKRAEPNTNYRESRSSLQGTDTTINKNTDTTKQK